MKIKEYTEICKRFADDTKEWAKLPNEFYMADTDCWRELIDLDERYDLIDVSWAFHMSADEVEAAAPQKMMDILVEEMTRANTEGWHTDCINGVLDGFR